MKVELMSQAPSSGSVSSTRSVKFTLNQLSFYALTFMIMLSLAASATAQARTLTVLHTFGAVNDGSFFRQV